MIFHRVLLVALLAASATWAQPQRQRQSPLSMGMRFLDNIRDGISNTFQGIFGNGNVRQNKEQSPGRPFQQQLGPRPLPPTPPPQPLLPSAPGPHVAPEVVHHSGSDATPPPSSFFTVVHEQPQQEVSTSFPDIQGFTDESFQPSTFFTGNNPFQGTVEEEELSFNNEVAVNNPQNIPRPPSFLVTNDPEAPKHSAPISFSSFGKSQLDSTIPFGNTASFSLGKLRDSPAPVPTPARVPVPDPVPPRAPAPAPAPAPASFSSQELREVPRPTIHNLRPTPFVQKNTPRPLVHRPSPSSTVHRPTTTSPKPTTRSFVQRLHPTTHSFVQRPQPTHRPFASLKPKPSSTLFKASVPFKSNEHATKVPKHAQPVEVVRPASVAPPLPLHREVTHIPPPPSFEARPQREAFKKPVRAFPKVGGGHINTGTKMTVVNTHNEDGTQATKVKGYEFGYGVLDGDTGNQYFHAEKREEGLTKGSYKIQLPDGRIQTVTYVADDNGFHPKITYEGEAKYPDAKKA